MVMFLLMELEIKSSKGWGGGSSWSGTKWAKLCEGGTPATGLA